MKFSGLLLGLSIHTACNAHTIMQAVNGRKQGDGIYMPADDSFIGDVNSNSMACNGAPVNYFRSSSTVIPVTAGQRVTGAWLHTLTSTGPDASADNKVIDSSHKGPVTAWLKKVNDATKNPSSGPGGGWFKISEAGLSNGKWAVDDLISAGGIQTTTIPTCIENGDYLLRFELIALHSAEQIGGAQFYMECAQIRVSGGTGTAKPATVSIPGVYSANDPGIRVSIYDNYGRPYPSSYKIPGPRPFTCPSNGGAGGGGSNPNPPAATTTRVSNGGGGSGGAALYGQCGGIGFSGPTYCAQGTCKKSNDWYSQCL